MIVVATQTMHAMSRNSSSRGLSRYVSPASGLDSHPGGLEVMMEVMGKYADGMLEGIGPHPFHLWTTGEHGACLVGRTTEALRDVVNLRPAWLDRPVTRICGDAHVYTCRFVGVTLCTSPRACACSCAL